MARRLVFAAVVALAAVVAPIPVGAAGSGQVCAGWGCGSFDYVLTSSGPRVIGMADDTAADGACVYLYVRVNGQWGRWASSCGAGSTVAATLPHGTTVGSSAILTRGPWGADRITVADPTPGT